MPQLTDAERTQIYTDRASIWPFASPAPAGGSVDVLGLIEQGLWNKATASSELTTLLGGNKIYFDAPPAGTVPPYVIIQLAGGGDNNICPVRFVTPTYSVQGIAEDRNLAGSIDGALTRAYHNQSLTVTGWNPLYFRRATAIAVNELSTDGRRYYHRGANYEIQVAEA